MIVRALRGLRTGLRVFTSDLRRLAGRVFRLPLRAVAGAFSGARTRTARRGRKS